MQISGYTPQEIQSNKFPLNWYKSNVNLIDFAMNMYGYEINYKHTSKIIDNTTSWVSLKHPENGDHIIITLSSQDIPSGPEITGEAHFYYRNTSPDSFEPLFGKNKYDQGSVFDFIQFRDQLSLGDCIRKIKKFLVSDFPDKKQSPSRLRLSVSKPVPQGIDLYKYYNVKSIAPSNIPFYIENLFKVRDIPIEILSDNKFKNHIFFREYTNAKDQPFKSACFPIISPSEREVGFFSLSQNDKQNGSFKEILGFKQDGLWFSGFDKAKPLDKLIIIENPIDALSHYILNPDLHGKNILYAATIGTISQHQCKSLDLIVDQYKPEKVVGACDFDAAGQKYNSFIVGQSSHHDPVFEIINVHQNTNKHHQGCVNISFSCGNTGDNMKQFRIATSLIESLNNINTDKVSEGKPFSLQLNSALEKEVNFSVNFYSLKENWKNITEFIHAFKNEKSFSFVVETPFNKDWNEDLSSTKNLFEHYRSFEEKSPEMVPEILKGAQSFRYLAGTLYHSELKQEIITHKSATKDKELVESLKNIALAGKGKGDNKNSEPKLDKGTGIKSDDKGTQNKAVQPPDLKSNLDNGKDAGIKI